MDSLNPFFIHYSTVTDLAKFLGLSTSQPLFLPHSMIIIVMVLHLQVELIYQ